jgi:hypothetical protein
LSLAWSAPAGLWLLPLWLGLLLWLRRGLGGAQAWRAHVDPALRAWVLMPTGRRWAPWLGPRGLYLTGSLAVLLALAGPVLTIGGEPLALTRGLVGAALLCAALGFRRGWLGCPGIGGRGGPETDPPQGAD